MIVRTGDRPCGAAAPSVVVIGGGFSGAMTAANLIRFSQAPIRITLIESAPGLGRGLAYATQDPSHLLNVPADRMGALADDVEGFHRWARRTLGDVEPGAFLPRQEFGRYVESTLMTIAGAAPPHALFERLRDEAEDITPDGEGATIALTSGARINADAVVLALGGGPARMPEVFADIADDHSLVIPSPFRLGALDTIGKHDRVLIAGSGLTMFDAAISLARRGFAGEIVAVSRRGRAPQPHRSTDTPEWVSQWASQLAQHGGVRWLLLDIRAAISAAEREGCDWRSVIDAMRPHLAAIWQSLSNVERAQFLRHAAPHWEVARHRCAPEVAAAINALEARGSLSIIAGRIIHACRRGERIAVTMQGRGDARRRVGHFDRIIVCAGPETDVAKWPSPLMSSALSQGLVQPDELRLGVRTDADGCALSSANEALRWLRIVGPLRKADLWESTAVPELRVQACAAAQRTLEFVHSLEARGATALRTASTHPLHKGGSS